MSVKISIIIPNYNGEKLLPECLESIKGQSFTDYETIVVDDCSQDHSLDLLKDYPVKVLINKVNLGFAGTVNRGISAAEGEYLLLLNNDVVLREDFLGNILEQIEKRPEIFSVSSKMLRYYEKDTIDDTGDQYTVFGWVYKRGDGDPATAYSSPGAVFSSCAGAGLYRRSTFETVGLFDRLHFAYLEDVDVGWRARILGYENVYEPSAVCYHIGSATFGEGNKYSENKVRLSARNNLYIIYKNMPALQIFLNLPTLALGFGIKYLYFRHYGFEKAYTEGLIEGVKSLKQLKRVPFRRAHLKNYIKIQKEMLVSSCQYIGDKALKILPKVLGKVKNITHKKTAVTRSQA